MTPSKAFDDQKRHAKDRNIPFLFSYSEWLEMWLISGKWENRGKQRGCFQMCRFGDEGAYSPRNCYIGSVADNQKERHNHSEPETQKIIELYKNTRMSQKEIGAVFGVTQSAISKIVNNKRRSYGV
jgi:DNA-binding XRE family transcriptional regulator